MYNCSCFRFNDLLIMAHVTDINVEHLYCSVITMCAYMYFDIVYVRICIQLTTHALSGTYIVCMYSTVVLMALMCVFLCITTTEGHASIRGKYFSTVCVSNIYFHELL